MGGSELEWNYECGSVGEFCTGGKEMLLDWTGGFGGFKWGLRLRRRWDADCRVRGKVGVVEGLCKSLVMKVCLLVISTGRMKATSKERWRTASERRGKLILPPER